MRGRQIALFLCSVLIGACATSEHGNSELRTVSDPEALVGCTQVGILRERALATSVLGERDWRFWVRAQVTNLGGNTIVPGPITAIHPYVEVWSCPEEDVVAPK